VVTIAPMGLRWRGGAGSASGRAPLFSAPRQQKSAENENPLLEVVLNKPALVSAPSKNRSPADFGLHPMLGPFRMSLRLEALDKLLDLDGVLSDSGEGGL
jgi:hypothetical protein